MENKPTRYGQTDFEKLAEEKEQARQIVYEISNFGVSQRQQLFVIYLLAMELENVDHMRQISSLIRELGEKDLFIVDNTPTE